MNLSHVNGINRRPPAARCFNIGRPVLSKYFTLSVLGIILYLLNSSANAAGPRPKDLYLNLGGGVFSPTFTLAPDAIVDRVDGELGVSTLLIPLIGPVPLQLGLAGQTDNAVSRPENRTILSLDGSLGYKYNRLFGVEINLDLGFPNILIRDVGLGNVLASDTNSTGRIQILAPELLPIGASIYYTPYPDFLVSPYFGFGGMVVFLNNRRASSSATEVLIIEGDVEFGWMLQAGAHLDISQDWFGFFDIKYANIDEPQFETEQGIPAPVDSLEIRHIRVGVGLRF